MENFIAEIKAQVRAAANKIGALRRDDTLVFPTFTDLHTVDFDHEYVKKLTTTLNLISQNIACDAVIDLGDNFAMLGRDAHISNGELEKRFERVLTAIHEAAGLPIINVNGNHDAIGTDFFKPDFWNGIVKGKYGNTSAVYADEGSYYYVDFDKANTRLVILSLPHDSDVERDMPEPLWEFGAAQLEWLKNTALNTTKDVIILSHVPFYCVYGGDREATLGVWDGEREKVSYLWALCGEIKDINEASAIINEFSERGGGRLVAAFGGHTHKDSLWLPHEQKGTVLKNPLSCTQIVSAGACIRYGIERVIGVSVDIVVWTPSTGELHTVRVGDGDDRSISVLEKV